MMELRATKHSMLKLVRDYRNLIGVVMPTPSGKDFQFRQRDDGSYVLSYQKWGQSYRFVLKGGILRPMLIVEIYEDGILDFQDIIPLPRNELRARGMLVENGEVS